MKKTLLLLVLIIITPMIALTIPFPTYNGLIIDFYTDRPVSNAKLFVQVYAVMPDQPSIEIYRGFVYGNRLVLDKNIHLAKPLKAWLSKNIVNYKTSLIIDAWLVMPNKTLWVIRDKTILYEPRKIVGGHVIIKNVMIDLSNINNMYIKGEQEENNNATKNIMSDISPTEPVCYNLWVRDTTLSYTISDTEIPVVILNNSLYYSSPIYMSLAILGENGVKTELGLVFGYKLTQYGVDALELILYLGGANYEKTGVSFMNYTIVPANSVKYIYIKGEITHEFYKLYNTCSGYTGYEKERVYINSLEFNGNHIVGGVKNGLPGNEFMELLFGSADFDFVKTLQPNDYIYLSDIAQGYDTCSVGLSIGVPLGAILAIFAPETMPATLVALMPHIGVNLRGYSTVNIEGLIVNNGTVFPENLYVATSKIHYRAETCTYVFPLYYIDSR